MSTSSIEPARPTGLTATVSDRLVELSWSVGDASAIDHYRVALNMDPAQREASRRLASLLATQRGEAPPADEIP